MTAVLLALGASLSWGVADFVGPWQGRTLGTLRVMLWAQVGGLIAIGIVIGIRHDGPPGWGILWAVVAAVSGTAGLYVYYRGMAAGAMSVVAPIAGVSAIVPVAFGIATGDRPSLLQLTGIPCAILGVGLASQEHRSGNERKVAAGVGLALLAAVGYGFYFPPMHAAGVVDPFWGSFVFRIAATVVVGVAVLKSRPPLAVSKPKLLVLFGVGIGDTLGNILFAGAAGRGLVSVTSVLASLYPLVTVGLAAVVLGERVAVLQRLGVALTLLGVVLISV